MRRSDEIAIFKTTFALLLIPLAVIIWQYCHKTHFVLQSTNFRNFPDIRFKMWSPWCTNKLSSGKWFGSFRWRLATPIGNRHVAEKTETELRRTICLESPIDPGRNAINFTVQMSFFSNLRNRDMDVCAPWPGSSSWAKISAWLTCLYCWAHKSLP